MAYEDREYNRDRDPPPGGIGRFFHWLLFGRVPLFRAWGIHVHAHSALIISVAIVALVGYGPGFGMADNLMAASMLFLIVLLHEFGHCFACRWAGGEADEIVMHPLGGLALCRPPHHWWPNFLTVAGGPAVNVAICVVTGTALLLLEGRVPLLPAWITREPFFAVGAWAELSWWLYWIYQTSWTLLLFNLLPIFPLDGGQLVQSLLWSRIGYFRATVISCTVGIVGAAIGAVVAVLMLNIMLLLLAAMGAYYCFQLRRMTLAAGAYAFDDGEPSAAVDARERRREQREAERERRQREAKAAKDAQDERRLDDILAKISKQGARSLGSSDKRFLEAMTEAKRNKTRRR
jgi:Zn-dependent protease